jgi:hypothetical protein
MTMPDPDTGSPVAPFDVSDRANGVECSRIGEITSCDRRSPQ